MGAELAEMVIGLDKLGDKRWRQLATSVGGATIVDTSQATTHLYHPVQYEVDWSRTCRDIARTSRSDTHTHTDTRRVNQYAPPSPLRAGHNNSFLKDALPLMC